MKMTSSSRLNTSGGSKRRTSASAVSIRSLPSPKPVQTRVSAPAPVFAVRMTSKPVASTVLPA